MHPFLSLLQAHSLEELRRLNQTELQLLLELPRHSLTMVNYLPYLFPLTSIILILTLDVVHASASYDELIHRLTDDHNQMVVRNATHRL